MVPERVRCLYTESVMYEFGVFIGRFQPLHSAHLETIKFALARAATLVIGLGSCNQSPDTRNPWSGQERAEMILSCLTPEERSRIRFAYLEDFYYNNLQWVGGVQKAIKAHTGDSKSIKLIGHKKDSSSFYLKLFPQWGPYLETGINADIDASKIRNLLFTQDKISIKPMLPIIVYNRIVSWMETPEYKRLHDEQHYIWNEQEKWRGSEFPPHFVTVDAVCVCSGHILVVRRGGKYGRGQIALPGGYLNVAETLEKSCIRELKEETSIRIPKHELASMIVDHDQFDHPLRDLRGRVITHAFCFNLPPGELPQVKGSDDADKSWWMSILAIDENRDKFFSDHWHIIDRFRARGDNFKI
jgi:bifunctional NMN adenylyltransferase/nudix hydrolase